MWPFKQKPREPEGIPWGEFVKTHLVPIAGPGREMSWEEATRAAERERMRGEDDGGD